MGDLAPLLGYGGSGLLLFLAGWMFNSLRGIASAQAERAKDAEERRDQLELQLDEAREGRRKAEDAAADLAREVRGLREEVERLTREVGRLRTQLGAA